MAKSKPFSDSEIAVLCKHWKKKYIKKRAFSLALALKVGFSHDEYTRKFFTDGKCRKSVDDGYRSAALKLLDLEDDDFVREVREHENPISGNGSAAPAIASLAELERDHRCYSEAHEYQEAASIAESAMTLCREKPGDVAIWAARAGSAYRTLGDLPRASALYADARSAVERALMRDPKSASLQFLRGRIEFGRIVVDDYHRCAHFENALRNHGGLLATIDRFLARTDLTETERLDAEQRRPHPIRQQAEMLRYMGRYTDALSKIAEVTQEYPVFEFEPRAYSDLGSGDCYRLTGDNQRARLIYSSVLKIAEAKSFVGLQCGVLWRLAEIAKSEKDWDGAQSCTARLHALVSSPQCALRFGKLYALLTAVSTAIQAQQWDEAERCISDAVNLNHLSDECLRAEYAHTRLFLGEMARRQNKPSIAIKFLEEALSLYRLMPMNWGIVRASLALTLAGKRTTIPKQERLEGLDAKVLKAAKTRNTFDANMLIVNFP